MNSRLSRIRCNEEKSHMEIYTKEKLFDSNTWLRKPIKTVEEIIHLFDEYSEVRVLDLGCGVGRNSIFVAQSLKGKNCSIDCVDILKVAIELLEHNAGFYDVSKSINGIVKPIEEYDIAIVCLVINSEVHEKNLSNGREIEPNFEVNLPTDILLEKLYSIFTGWDIVKRNIVRKNYEIPRENLTSSLSTNVVTFVARKDIPE